MTMLVDDRFVAHLETLHEEAVEADRLARGRYVRELDEEIDRMEAAGAPVAEEPADPITRRVAAIEADRARERAAASALPGALGQDGWRSGDGVRAQERRARWVWRLEQRRREAEEAAGLPALQAHFDGERQAIASSRDAALREAQAACAKNEAAARSRAEKELGALGKRPTLETVEVQT
jgi:hypothetical protein